MEDLCNHHPLPYAFSLWALFPNRNLKNFAQLRSASMELKLIENLGPVPSFSRPQFLQKHLSCMFLNEFLGPFSRTFIARQLDKSYCKLHDNLTQVFFYVLLMLLQNPEGRPCKHVLVPSCPLYWSRLLAERTT